MIRVDANDGFSVLTIDRDERANALNAEHATGIANGVRASIERGDRSLVITGEGRAFSAGADFGEVSGGEFRAALFDMLRSITSAPMPVVAAVNGHAIGAGLQLAIACDLRVVAPTATFAVPTARLGLAVDPWTIERLVALVGGGPARRLLMTCARIAADDLAMVGLVDQRGTLDDAVTLAADLAGMAPLTLRYIKTTVDALANGSHDSTEAQSAFEACWKSEDFVEGLAARAEKRSAIFRGE
jgi:enoyl-CoA hydratase